MRHLIWLRTCRVDERPEARWSHNSTVRRFESGLGRCIFGKSYRLGGLKIVNDLCTGCGVRFQRRL